MSTAQIDDQADRERRHQRGAQDGREPRRAGRDAGGDDRAEHERGRDRGRDLPVVADDEVVPELREAPDESHDASSITVAVGRRGASPRPAAIAGASLTSTRERMNQAASSASSDQLSPGQLRLSPPDWKTPVPSTAQNVPKVASIS